MRRNAVELMILTIPQLLRLLFVRLHAILAQRSPRARETDVEIARDACIAQVAFAHIGQRSLHRDGVVAYVELVCMVGVGGVVHD